MATRSRRSSPADHGAAWPHEQAGPDTSGVKSRGRSPLVAAVNREVRERHYASSSEAAHRSELSQLPPPIVKRALVHATSVLTTRDQERVLSVDMRPLVIHLLAALEQAGIERAVVTLGHNATQVAECVTEYGFTRLQIDFVYLTLGSAVGAVWCSLANSVIAARALFTGKEPLLIVRADNLYDCRLLRKIADAPFGKERRYQAYALVDDTPTAVGWATSVRNNWARVALATHDRQCAVRCSPRLGAFDAVVAGEVYATTPQACSSCAHGMHALPTCTTCTYTYAYTYHTHMHMHIHIHITYADTYSIARCATAGRSDPQIQDAATSSSTGIRPA